MVKERARGVEHEAAAPPAPYRECPTEHVAEAGEELAALREALAQSEARYRAVTTLSSDWYWEHDPDQRFTLVSAAIHDRTGDSADMIVGRTRWEADIRYDHAERTALEAAIAARRSFYDFQYERDDRNGAVRRLSVSGEPMFDAAGRYSGYRGVGKDITERRRAETAAAEASRSAHATLDALASEVCVLDATGKILTVNEAWRRSARANGAGAHAFRSVNYLAVCDAAYGAARDDALAVATAIRAAIAGSTDRFRHEYPCDRPTERRWYAVSVSRFAGHGIERAVVGHEDITERKQATARIERVNTLYRTLSETNDAIARIRERGELLHAIAEIATRSGGFGATLVWMRETESAPARVVARAGEPCVDADDSGATIDLAATTTPGPAAVALREGRPDVCNDLAERRARSEQPRQPNDSFRSCAAFPLREDGEIVGAISVYASEAGYFDGKLIELLVRVAASVSIAFDQIAHDAKRQAAEAALRESEARFRSLTELSADWYWQQDAQLRVISSCNGTEIRAGLAPDADLGKVRWEIAGVEDTDWTAHKADLAARKPFRDFELKRTFPDGMTRDISLSGEPIFDADGRFAGYRGVGRDITERKCAERILTLEHVVARCVAEKDDAGEVMGTVIRAICDTQHWVCGAYFDADVDANVLRMTRFWATPGSGADPFYAQTRDVQIPRNVGVSGRVWQTAAPMWIHDVTADDRPLFRDVILAAGARGVFAFPTIANGKAIGVFIFFSREVREPDDRLLAAVGVIGGQVGQFLQRKHAEDALRESEARYRALTELSSDWFWEHDEHQRFTRMSGGMMRGKGIDRTAILGKTRWDSVTGYDPRRRTALEATLEARRPFRAFEYRRIGADGVARDVEISGEPMFDGAGRYTGYRGIGRDITERKAAEDRLRFQALLLDTVGDAVIATDVDGAVTYWNDSAEQLYGWSAAEARGRNVLELTRVEENRADGLATLRRVAIGRIWRGETNAKRRDGTTFPAQLTLAPIPDEQGSLCGLIGVSRDVSEIKRAEQAIRDNARQQSVIAAFGQHALASASQAELLDRAAIALAEGLAIDLATIVQPGPAGLCLIARAGGGWQACAHRDDGATDGKDSFEDHVLRREGAVIVDDFRDQPRHAQPAMLAGEGMRSGVHVVIGGIGGPFGVLAAYSRAARHFSAISAAFLQSIANILTTAIDRRSTEDRIARLVQFDALTGLPNRNLLRDRLAQTVAAARRDQRCIGVMFLDLDGFKLVNDTFGHSAGDDLLALAAKRLRDSVREGDIVGRLGGDEFAIVLSSMANAGDATFVAQHIVDALASPFDLGGREVRVTASLGVAVFPDDGEDSEQLLKNADTAMYRAKERGRNGCEFYTPALNTCTMERVALEQELRNAVARREFFLCYQPVLSLDSGQIVGVEALIRWQHPTRGTLEPGEFIALAEETGLVVPIGLWVLETACAQTAQWHRAGHTELFVAVNVSSLEIRRGEIPKQVHAALARSGLPPRHLEIEVTETMGMNGAEPFIETLQALKAIGVRIAIDDFGTGYSTLGYLTRFPIDKVKIDRMFVRDVIRESDDGAIVQAIIAMAHHLRLHVTAEGVETAEQAAYLRRWRCDSAQGFLFGKPLGPEALGARLDGASGHPAWFHAQGSRRSLLLVDDDPVVLGTLVAVLRDDGYEIHTAGSAQEALALLAGTRIAVIVTEQRMAKMSGTEFLRRAKVLYPDSLRIVLSGHTDRDTVTAAINDGAVYKFLAKPWNNAALRNEVRQAFHCYEQQANLRMLPSAAQAAI